VIWMKAFLEEAWALRPRSLGGADRGGSAPMLTVLDGVQMPIPNKILDWTGNLL